MIAVPRWSEVTAFVRGAPGLVKCLVVAALLILVCAPTVVLWPAQPGAGATAATLGLALIRNRPPEGAVGVTQVSAPLLWTGPEAPTALVTVANSSSQQQAIRVWWILGRPGDQAVWRDPLLEAVHTNAVVAAHSTHMVSVSAPLGAHLPKNGSYTLTLWVHTVAANGQETHSDGVAVASPMTVALAPKGMVRTTIAADPQAVVLAIENPTVVRGASVPLLVTVGVTGARQVSVQVTATTACPSGSTTSPPVVSVLDPGPPSQLRLALPLSGAVGESCSVTASLSTVLPDGQPQLTATGTLDKTIRIP